jgi:hypothetical protein
MQGQMMIGQAFEQYTMLDLANRTFTQCWDVCYDRNLTQSELTSGDISHEKLKKMSACQHKCVARSFEVMKLMNESRVLREKEQVQGLPPGSLKPGTS